MGKGCCKFIVDPPVSTHSVFNLSEVTPEKTPSSFLLHLSYYTHTNHTHTISLKVSLKLSELCLIIKLSRNPLPRRGPYISPDPAHLGALLEVFR